MINVVRNSLGFVLLLLLQIFLFNHLVLFRMAIPYVFPLFLFMLPLRTPRLLVYPLAFFMGLMVDIFSDHAATGLHAFSCLLAVALRPWLANILGASNFRVVEEIDLPKQSSVWLLMYLAILFFVHHFSYFLLEDFTFLRLFHVLGKTIFSTIYSSLLAFLIVFVFYKR